MLNIDPDQHASDFVDPTKYAEVKKMAVNIATEWLKREEKAKKDKQLKNKYVQLHNDIINICNLHNL